MKTDPFEFYLKGIAQDHLAALPLLYEEALAFLDDSVWDFYKFLKEAGLLDECMFIATSDHGEILGEHSLWGHHFSLYNEVLQIPLIVKYPAHVGQPSAGAGLTQLNDLFATIMELTQVPLPAPESSVSLLSGQRDFAVAEHFNPWLTIDGCRRRDPTFRTTRFMQPCRAIIDANLHKLVEWLDGSLEFYDLKQDVGEEQNLVRQPELQDRVGFLKQKLGELSDEQIFNSLKKRLGEFAD